MQPSQYQRALPYSLVSISLMYSRLVREMARIALCLALACSGCIKPLLPQQVMVRVPRECASAVKGKKIVIDPGHGGPERGAIGKNGLHEAEVNLGVALYLWGLLQQAGAHPVLTRSTDTCVSQCDPFDLTRELRARAEIANKYSADLFISIHHNADAHNRRRNDLIVFYKMSDPGQSRDVARELKTALARTLTPQKASIQPGNFHVLRSSHGPAVLGEASFITTEETATLLAYHRTLAAEATGYFQGICAYFQKGVPHVFDCAPDNTTIADPTPQITCRAYSGADNASIDPSSLVVRLDDMPLPTCSVQDTAISCSLPHPLANGVHRYCVTVRNQNGNISAPYCASFVVALPPQHLTITSLPSTIPPEPQVGIPLTIQASDALRRPVADGTAIEIWAKGGNIEPNRVSTVRGAAQVLLYPAAQNEAAVVHARCGDAEARIRLAFGRPEVALFLARIVDSGGKPVGKASLVRGEAVVAVSDMFGFVYDSVATSGTVDYRLQKKGYEEAQIRVSLVRGSLSSQTVCLKPRDGGVFFNRTVMLDRADERENTMQLAAALAIRIEEAGGSAVYAWQTPPAPPDAQRALAASRAGASFYIRFASSKRPAVLHYYKSIAGKELATSIARCMNSAAAGERHRWEAQEGTDYILAHTAMPAVIIAMSGKAGSFHDTASCIYNALRDFFTQPSAATVLLSDQGVSP